MLDDELLRFWKVLNENKVRYIMVGGFATRFHGFNRNTDDLDMWLEDTIENRKNLRIWHHVLSRFLGVDVIHHEIVARDMIF